MAKNVFPNQRIPGQQRSLTTVLGIAHGTAAGNGGRLTNALVYAEHAVGSSPVGAPLYVIHCSEESLVGRSTLGCCTSSTMHHS